MTADQTDLRDPARYGRALAMATELHAGQVRKGKTQPYIAHLLAVSATVWRYGGGEDAAIAGLLHDAVEDCGGLPVRDRIAAEFGADVARMVMDCTDSTVSDRAEKLPWRDRKTEHVAHLEELAREGSTSCVVVAADKVDNGTDLLRDLELEGPAVWSRFNAGPADQVWYYRSVADALTPALPPVAATELRRVADGLAAHLPAT